MLMWGGQVADAVQAALTAELKEMQKIAGGLREHRDEVEGRILDNNACIEQAADEPSERHLTGVERNCQNQNVLFKINEFITGLWATTAVCS